MRRNWIAGCLGLLGLSLIGYASFGSHPDATRGREGFAPDLARGDETPFLPGTGEMEGEVPLFESAGEPPAPAGAPYTEVAAAGPAGSPAAPVAGGAFQAVSADHWVVRAIQEVFPEGVGDLPLGETPRNVTRYELAVALARVFEIYRDDSSQRPAIDVERLALLEKLGGELREELSLLGVDQRSVKGQIDGLTSRLGKVESGLASQSRSVKALEARVAELASSLRGQETRTLELAQRMKVADAERGKIGNRGEALSKVVSRLVVKNAVAAARGGSGGGVSTAKVRALEERVKDLEETGPVSSDVAAGRMVKRIKRLERLVVKAYEGKSGGSRIDSARVDALRRQMDALAQRVEQYRTRAASSRGGGVDDGALDEVKDLMKGFFSDFDRRLGKVERSVM